MGMLVGFEKKRVTHPIVLKKWVTHILPTPQWSTYKELHISNIPMDKIHMRGMSLLGFVRTRSCVDIGLTSTPDDVLFFTKYFGEECVMGICCSNGMVLYNISKETFAWGNKSNVKVDLETFLRSIVSKLGGKLMKQHLFFS